MIPLIVGRWDGLRVWVQWDASVAYDAVDYQMTEGATPDAVPDAPWISVPLTEDDRRRGWKVLYLAKHGAFVRARFTRAGGSSVLAAEATFVKCWAAVRLTLTQEREPVTLPKGTLLCAMIDGHTVAYSVPVDVELQPREPQEVTLYSESPDPFHQVAANLEYGIKDFVTGLALNVSHTQASRNDMETTGRLYTTLTHRNPHAAPSPASERPPARPAVIVVTGHVQDEMRKL